MQVIFWGVRGSLSAPLTAQQVQSKIAAIVQRITPSDIADADARQYFLSRLPDWLYGTVGGNTACTQLITDSGSHIILDAGTGLRELGMAPSMQSVSEWHLFLSHYHWDHIQGLPFFAPAYNPNTIIHIYGPQADLHNILSGQMSSPYFPVTFDGSFTRNITFHPLNDGDTFELRNVIVSCRKMFHPGGSFAYSFEEKNKKFVYATDVELKGDVCCTGDENDFFTSADMLIFDAQYTELEADQKRNWGHSAFGNVIDFAGRRGVKNVYLFHHDPAYNDKKLYAMFEAARKYIIASQKNIAVHLAAEGLMVTV